MAKVKETSGVEPKRYAPEQPSVKLLLHRAGAFFGFERRSETPAPGRAQPAHIEEHPETEFDLEELWSGALDERPREHSTSEDSAKPPEGASGERPRQPSRPGEPSERKAGERYGLINLPKSVREMFKDTAREIPVVRERTDDDPAEGQWFEAGDPRANEEEAHSEQLAHEVERARERRRPPWSVVVASIVVGCALLAGVWLGARVLGARNEAPEVKASTEKGAAKTGATEMAEPTSLTSHAQRRVSVSTDHASTPAPTVGDSDEPARPKPGPEKRSSPPTATEATSPTQAAPNAASPHPMPAALRSAKPESLPTPAPKAAKPPQRRVFDPTRVWDEP